MADIVQFPKADKLIFVCRCGCQSFHIHETGEVECCVCNNLMTDHADDIDIAPGEWVKRELPPIPDETDKTDAGTLVVYQLNDMERTKRNVVKAIDEWSKSGEMVTIYGINRNGMCKSWFDYETAEQRNWIVEKLTNCIESLKKRKLK